MAALLEMQETESSISMNNQNSSTPFSTSPVSFSTLFGNCLQIDFPIERTEPTLLAIGASNNGDLLCVPVTSSSMEMTSPLEDLSPDGLLMLDKSLPEACASTVDSTDLMLGYDSGCHSEEQTSSKTVADAPKKRRGGWPKGKKRKQRSTETKAPKAPATGYVIYLNERGKEMRDSQPHLSFTEVTKILGHEWTKTMTAQDKEKYLRRAEEDKKRYREELKAFQHLEAYQVFLKKKKLKSHHSIENKQSPSFTLHDIEEEDGCDLYCEVCKQFFVSLHNKREHLYGRQHLQAITGELHKDPTDCNLSKDEGHPSVRSCDNGETCRRRHGPANVSQAIQDLVTLNVEREEELKHLQAILRVTEEAVSSKQAQLELYREDHKTQEMELRSLKLECAALSAQLVSLRMVPQLFGVIKF